MGFFLPCKLVVYEKESLVYIGMIRPEELIKMLGNEELVEIAGEVENELKEAIEKSIH